MNIKYDASSIKVLEGLEAVRKNPGMYIGDVSTCNGIIQMAMEVLDNSIDEVLAGFCDFIEVCILADGSISIFDNGRGIPVDVHSSGKPACEVILCVLHSGAKFDRENYKFSGGLHGVGLSVVNALSEFLNLSIYRENKVYYQKFSKGKPLSILESCQNFENFKTGTLINFKPDPLIFSQHQFTFDLLFNKIKEKAFLNKGLKLKYVDKKYNDYSLFFYKEGIIDYLKELCINKYCVNNNFFYLLDKKNCLNNPNISYDLCLCWCNDYEENVFCFTNSIKNSEGGTHLIGLKNSLIKGFNYFINNENKNKNEKINLIYDDIKEGMNCVISIKMSNPIFDSQIKNKLVSIEVKNFLEKSIYEEFCSWLNKNHSDSKLLIKKVLDAYNIRINNKKKKELNKIKLDYDKIGLAVKLSDCCEKDFLLREIFIVEGDSAGGSAKNARDKNFQAILPLKGKIINVEKNKIQKILVNKEIISLISALGAGIEGKDFDLNKLRYNKIIIMTDADSDGAHIRSLLLTFFYRKMKEIILNGNLFIAQPPLFKARSFIKKKDIYFINGQELEFFLLDELFFFNTFFINEKKLEISEYFNILNNFNEYLSVLNFLNGIFDIKIFFFLIKNFNFNFFSIQQTKIEKINSYFNKFKPFSFITDFNLYFKKDVLILDYKKQGFSKKIIFNNSYINYEKIKNFFELYEKNFNFFFFFNFIKNGINKKKRFNFFNLIKFFKKQCFNNREIQRYKGLGEMNADQLWETTMDPKNRTLLQVSVPDCLKADKVFYDLMGDISLIRKDCINNYNFNELHF